MTKKQVYRKLNEALKGIGINLLSNLIWVILASLITGFWGLINLIRGDTGLLTKVLLISGITLFWLLCLYIYYRRQNRSNIITTTNYKHRQAIYPTWIRRLASIGLVSIPVFAIALFLIWPYYQHYPFNQTVVLVANFEGPESKNYRVTETIINQLHNTLKKYSNVQVKSLNRTITAQEGSSVAQTIGRSNKASIIIWGWYGITREKAVVSNHFEILQGLIRLPLCHQEEQTLRAPASALESFAIQEYLSNEMSYLTLMTAGLLRYELKDYDNAILHFTDLIAVENSSIRNISAADIYLYRGLAYLKKGNLGQAIADYSQVIQLQPNEASAYYHRAIAYEKKVILDSAISDYSKAIQLQPSYACAYNNRGNIYFDKGDLSQAISDYNKAIKLQPEEAKFYRNRGLAYVKQGEEEKAQLDFKKSRELDGIL